MKENHRVESLEALSQSARRKRIRWFESSARVYAYSFDNANESKLSDESTILIYKESQRLDAPPPSNRVLRRPNSPSASSHKWRAYRRRRFCRFSRRERRSYFDPYVRSEQRRKSAKAPPALPRCLEMG